MKMFGYKTPAQHLHDLAIPENPEIERPLAQQALISIPGLFSPWFHHIGHRRQHTAALFDPMDEIIRPTKKFDHCAWPNNPVAPTSSSTTSTSGFRSIAVTTLESDPAITPDDATLSATSSSATGTIMHRESSIRLTDPLNTTKGAKGFPVFEDEEDLVDFANHRGYLGVDFLEMSGDKLRVTPPPGSASRLARILKERRERDKPYETRTWGFRPFDTPDPILVDGPNTTTTPT